MSSIDSEIDYGYNDYSYNNHDDCSDINSGFHKTYSASHSSTSRSTKSSRSSTKSSRTTKSSRRSSRSNSNKSASSFYDIDEMDYTAGSNSSQSTEAANRLLEESLAIQRFAKNICGICLFLVFAVFGFDMRVLEEFATVLVYNVVAAAILICGFNLATLLYEAMATPVPGSPQEDTESTPLQGLVRRQSSQRSSVLGYQRRSNNHHHRPASITAPTPQQKRGSGGLFSGLWPRSKRSSKNGIADNNSKQQKSRSKSLQTTKKSKKLSFGRRRGWPSGRLSAGSI